jgi:GT2 family glycosyltransferase
MTGKSFLQELKHSVQISQDNTHLDKKESQACAPFVSVIIVNYNGRKFLYECIKSLHAQSYTDFEIMVVDNDSADDSIEVLDSEFPKIRVIRNHTNLGYAGGMNEGIRHTKSSYIMTLNNDTRLESRCIERLVDTMSRDDSIGMCATKMLFPDRRINSTGICIARSGATWDRGIFEADEGQYDVSEEIFAPCAGAALYRRAMLDEIGLFDEDFFLYIEDADLGFRGHLAGWKCVYVPDAVVYHKLGGTGGFMSDLAVYYGNRNILWYPVKNFPLTLLLTSLPWIIGRTIGVIPYYAMRGQGIIILKSKLDGLLGLPKMLKKRKSLRRSVPVKEIKKFLQTWSSINRELHVDH